MLRKIAQFFDYQLGPRRAMRPATSHASTPLVDEDRAPTAFAKFGSLYAVPADTGDMLAGHTATSMVGLHDELYMASYARQVMPDPGAMCYSWETLGLAQQMPLGTGTPVTDMPKPTAPAGVQIYEGWAFGTPNPYDQIAGQQLLDASNNPVPGSGINGMGLMDLSQVAWNIPTYETVPGFPAGGFNDPFPQRMKAV